MKVLHIIPDVNGGGASKATFRIHNAIKEIGIESNLLVLRSNSKDKCIHNINAGISGWIGRKFYKKTNRRFEGKNEFFTTQNQSLHSFGLMRRGIVGFINRSNADIIHLHWIIGMLSIEDIGLITKPLAWTFHDMWPICGGEHYVMDDQENARFRVGYLTNNQPSYETGPDLNRDAWERKAKAWKNKNFHIATCSNWLAECARSSPLFRHCSIEAINYPLDLKKVFKPYCKEKSRLEFGLPQDKKIILAGAVGGVNNFYKGGDLLRDAVNNIANNGRRDIAIALFGSKSPPSQEDWNLPVYNIGEVHDENLLAKLYSASDVMVMPSRQEAFGQVASEALACGTPAIAFNKGGPTDIIAHKETGWLAKPFEIEDLARGIHWALNERTISNSISINSRKRAEHLFNDQLAGEKYGQMYQKMLKT